MEQVLRTTQIVFKFNKKYGLVVLGVVTVGTTICLGRIYLDEIRNYVNVVAYSRLMNLVSSKVLNDQRRILSECVAMDRHVVTREPTSHTHPVSAALRTKANKIVGLMGSRLGMMVFSVSKSKQDEHGDRPLLFAKDFAMPASFPKMQGIVKLIDVDYYVDVKRYIYNNPVLIYTFTPRFVCGNTADGCYTFHDNEMLLRVNGGAEYRQQLWDYDTDSIITDYWWGSVISLIERHMLSSDRSLIIINPIRRVYTPLAWLIPGKRLMRRRVKYGAILYSKNFINGQVEHSLSREGDYTSVEIPDPAFITAYLRFRAAMKPNMGDIERVLTACGVGNAHVAAALVYTAFCDEVFLKQIVKTEVRSNAIREYGYQTLAPLVLEDGVDTMRQISEPYFYDGVAAVRSYNNDVSCIQGRVLDVANKTMVSQELVDMSLEFVNRVIGEHENKLVPYSFDYIVQKWDRPSQRRLLDSVSMFLYAGRAVVRSFQKAESYAKITHPRNISTLPPDHNVRLGQFSYALTDSVFKALHWYGFGKHPVELAKRVHDKCLGTSFVVPSDVSRMDGSTGAFNEFCCQMLVSRVFAPVYKAEVIKLCQQEQNIRGKTKHNVKYMPTNNTLSGSSRTSWRNTFLNAKMSYVALRRSGLTKEEAWDRLGIYAGDDGLTWDINPIVLMETFKGFGLSLKAETVIRGKSVPFLGRFFLDPWVCIDTIADVPRQLRKLHLSATPKEVPINVVMLRRAEAYLVTDVNTPVLSDWARAVIRIVGQQSNRWDHLVKRDMPYWLRYEDPFPPTNLVELANDVVAEALGGYVEVMVLQARFNNAKTLDDLFRVPISKEPPKVEVSAVYQGQLLKAKKKKEVKPPAVPQRKCRNAERGRPCTRQNCPYAH
jgi:hypothetical protein